MLDLFVRIDKIQAYSGKRDVGEENGLSDELIQSLSAPSADQIMQRYKLYKDAWGLPDLAAADIESYVEALALYFSKQQQESLGCIRFEIDASDDLSNGTSRTIQQRLEPNNEPKNPVLEGSQAVGIPSRSPENQPNQLAMFVEQLGSLWGEYPNTLVCLFLLLIFIAICTTRRAIQKIRMK
jgi:hypothetical protein